MPEVYFHTLMLVKVNLIAKNMPLDLDGLHYASWDGTSISDSIKELSAQFRSYVFGHANDQSCLLLHPDISTRWEIFVFIYHKASLVDFQRRFYLHPGDYDKQNITISSSTWKDSGI